MTTHSEQIAAFALLAFIGILLFAPTKAPSEEGTARATVASADYRDEVIEMLQAEIRELEHTVDEWEQHHEAVHRGECSPRPNW